MSHGLTQINTDVRAGGARKIYAFIRVHPWFKSLCFFLFLLFPVYCLLSTVYCFSSDWPAFLGDAAHTGHTAAPAAPPLAQAWQFDAGGAIHSSPSKAGYLVFTGTANGTLYAVHAQTGNAVWSFAADGMIISAPAIQNDIVVVTTKKGNAYALRLTSGSLVWSADLGGTIFSSPTIAGDKVFISVGEPANKVAALMLDTGAPAWEFTAQQPFYSTPAVSGGTVWVGCDDGIFYGLSASGGALTASFTTAGLIYTSSPAIANGTVFGAAGEYDMNVYAFNAQTGAPVWQAAPVAGDSIVKISSVISNGSMVYLSIGYPQQKLVAMSAADGQLAWQAALGDLTGLNFAPSPAVANGVLYICSPDGSLRIFDAATGADLGSIALGGPTDASPAIADGMVFVSTRDGKLIAYLGADGAQPTAALDAVASPVSGAVAITGTAADDSFQSYVLEYGAGESPADWTTIYYSTLPVENNTLATWYTSEAADGDYTIRLTAADNSNNTASATRTATVDNTPPAFAGILSAQDATGAAATGGEAYVSWPAAADAHAPVTYRLYQSTATGVYDYDAPAATTTLTQLLIGGLATGTTYHFLVRAVDAVGNEDGNTIEKTVIPTAPPAPDTAPPAFAGIASATGSLEGIVTISYTAASDPSTPITYLVYQSAASGVFDYNAPVATTTQTQLSIAGFATGTTYYFAVRAEDSAGNTDENTVQAAVTLTSPPPAPDTAPPAFAGIAAAAASLDRTITISYTAASDPSAPITYKIFQSTTSGDYGGFSTPSWTATQTTSATGPLAPGTYYFVVRAADAAGNEDANTIEKSAAITSSPGPAIQITAPQNCALQNAAGITVTGLTDPFATITLNGAAVAVSPDGSFSAAVTLAEGANTLVFVSADSLGNTNSLVLTLTLDTTPPAAAITSPAAGAVVSSAVAIAGTASDENFKSYKVEYGAGAAPASWSPVAESTTGVTSGAITTWSAGALGGAYTIRLTAEDTAGNIAVATRAVTVRNEVAISGTLAAGKWHLISLPAEVENSDPKAIFGSAGYKLMRWDPAAAPDPVALNYVYPSSLQPGEGFAVYPFSGDLAYSATGAIPYTTSDYPIELAQGWNMIGTPYPRAFRIGALKVKKGDAVYTFDDAANAGLISSVLFSYADGGYTQNPAAWNVEPQTGYFLKAYDSVQLLFDSTLDEPIPAGRTLAKIVRSLDKTIRISASAGGLSDRDNLLGLSPGAADGLDVKDVEEPPKGGDSYLSLYFTSPAAEGSESARLANDMRDPAAGEKTYAFEIETSETGGDVTVTWDADGIAAAYYTAILEDLSTGAKMDMSDRNSYTFTPPADKSARKFTVTITKTGAAPLATVTRALPAGWNLVSFPVEPEVTGALKQLADDLPEMEIFQFYDKRFYTIEHRDGVDIQAGLGYWVHVDDELTVDVEGVPLDPSAPVKVPLAAGWNLIGNPFAQPLAWGDNIAVAYAGQTANLSEAADRGWLERTLYEYTADGYRPVPEGAEMEAWKGYFLRSRAACELIMKK